MPTIAIIDGVSIRMYPGDHPPPHFHAQFAEHSAVVEIQSGRITMGSLPPAKAKRVLVWAEGHRAELFRAWAIASQGRKPGKVDD